jgi:GWxTD domain-containing protein
MIVRAAFVVRFVRVSSLVRVAAALGLLIVLWNIDPVVVHAQEKPPAVAERDSSRSDSVARMLFGPHDAATTHHEKILRAIVTGGAGLYWQFTDLHYVSIFEPTAGVDFYAAPEGGIGFLIGAHAGFIPRFSTSIGLGARVPLKSSDASRRFFLDGQILFFDDGIEPQAFQTGARLALSHAWFGRSFSEDVKLAFEYRGTARAVSVVPVKPLLWVGIEAGISFSLIAEQRQFTRKDSIRAALKFVATPEELSDFDAISSPSDLDSWLRGFWTKREQVVGGSGEDVESEFYSRAAIANAKFSRAQRLGVETDPGRFIVIYGLPDNSVTGFSIADQTVEYMLWTYHQRIRGTSNAVVIFRRQGSGDWRQEYSNVQGEQAGTLPYDLPLNIQEALPPFIR